MESSRALSLCIQQLQLNKQSSLHTQAVKATRTISSRTRPRTSYRPFSTASRHYEEDSQSPTPARAPRQPQRMDLSSISSNPDYKTPARARSPPRAQPPADAALRNKAMSHLDSLIASEKSRLDGKPSPKRQTPAPASNYDLFGGWKARTPAGGPGARSAPNYQNQQDLMKGIVGASVRDERDDLSAAKYDVVESALRLKPSLGRSIQVTPSTNMDLTRAFVTLESKINGREGKVKKDERDQKYHVRKGQARKIHRRARWRVLFKEGFLAECARVRKMIRQGW